MKKTLLGLMTLMSLALTACPGTNSGNNSNTVTTQATTPLDPRCLNGTTYCPQQNYNSYYMYGWMAYPQYYYNGISSNGYFCSCPSGYSPTYNPSWGLGCLASSYLAPFQSFTVVYNTWSYYGYPYTYAYTAPVYTNNNVNIPQVSNMQGGDYAASCNMTTLTQSCFVNQANSCGGTNRCVPTVSGSPIGICTTPL